MWNKIKNWLLPKEEEFKYNVLVQAEPERKVVVVKKAAAKKPAAKKKAPAKKSPVTITPRRSKWENTTIRLRHRLRLEEKIIKVQAVKFQGL